MNGLFRTIVLALFAGCAAPAAVDNVVVDADAGIADEEKAVASSLVLDRWTNGAGTFRVTCTNGRNKVVSLSNIVNTEPERIRKATIGNYRVEDGVGIIPYSNAHPGGGLVKFKVNFSGPSRCYSLRVSG